MYIEWTSIKSKSFFYYSLKLFLAFHLASSAMVSPMGNLRLGFSFLIFLSEQSMTNKTNKGPKTSPIGGNTRTKTANDQREVVCTTATIAGSTAQETACMARFFGARHSKKIGKCGTMGGGRFFVCFMLPIQSSPKLS